MSQVFGRRSVFLGIGVFRLLALPACCLLMTKTDNLLLLCLLAALFGSCGNAAYAPLLVFLNERFPTTMRASGVGFSWSVGFAIGGTVLAAHTPAQLPITLTAFLVGSSILYLIGGLLVPETRGRVNPE
jgi:MFS family permease